MLAGRNWKAVYQVVKLCNDINGPFRQQEPYMIVFEYLGNILELYAIIFIIKYDQLFAYHMDNSNESRFPKSL